MCIRWGNAISQSFTVSNGVKQGGIISPILFNVYMDGVSVLLNSSNIGGQVQLSPRYEGQLNPMAEPIPHEVRPLVRTHVYHPYHAADRQAETDS